MVVEENVCMRLKIYNERFIKLIEWATASGKVKNDIEFYKKIGIQYGRDKISRGVSVSKNHLKKAAAFTGVSIKWLLGCTNRMFSRNKSS